MTTRMEKLIIYAAMGGVLTEHVSQKLSGKPSSGTKMSPKDFKQEYEKADSAKKQKLIFENAPAPTEADLRSVSIPMGNNTLIIQVLKKPVVINAGTPYAITPNPAPATLQALANKWFPDKGGMILPTNKLIKVFEQDPSVKNVYVNPLSSGYSHDGKSVSGRDVANNVGKTEYGLDFAKKVEQKLSGADADSYRVSSKSIIQPWDSGDNRITFAGPYQKSVSQSGANMAHAGAVKAHHTEYEILIQDLAVNRATLKGPSGTKQVYLKDLLKSPTLYSYIGDRPGYSEYDTSPVIR